MYECAADPVAFNNKLPGAFPLLAIFHCAGKCVYGFIVRKVQCSHFFFRIIYNLIHLYGVDAGFGGFDYMTYY